MYRSVYRTRQDISYMDKDGWDCHSMDMKVQSFRSNIVTIRDLAAGLGWNMDYNVCAHTLNNHDIVTDSSWDPVFEDENMQDTRDTGLAIKYLKGATIKENWIPAMTGDSNSTFYFNIKHVCVPRNKLIDEIAPKLDSCCNVYKVDEYCYMFYRKSAYSITIVTDNLTEETFKKAMNIALDWVETRQIDKYVHFFLKHGVTVPEEVVVAMKTEHTDAPCLEWFQSQIERIKAEAEEAAAKAARELTEKTIAKIESITSEIGKTQFKIIMAEKSHHIKSLDERIRETEVQLSEYKATRQRDFNEYFEAADKLNDELAIVPSLLRTYKNISVVSGRGLDTDDIDDLNIKVEVVNKITNFDKADAKGLFRSNGDFFMNSAIWAYILFNVAIPECKTDFVINVYKDRERYQLDCSGIRSDRRKGNPHLEFFNCWGTYSGMLRDYCKALDANGLFNLMNQITQGISLLDSAVMDKFTAQAEVYKWYDIKTGAEIPSATIKKLFDDICDGRGSLKSEVQAWGKSLYGEEL